jgi:prepilin-type N-terminal cleavage/methylation domain-containing protein/prepilin-type processing-associated H-X9-DG protein
MGMRTRRAFTLVELLVVIGIIGLLIAILLPTLSQARQQAQGVACMSNMRQLGMAFLMYADENQGQFPTCGINFRPTDDVDMPWDSLLLPYTMEGTFWVPGPYHYFNVPIELCPADYFPAYDFPPFDSPGAFRRSYSMVYRPHPTIPGEFLGMSTGDIWAWPDWTFSDYPDWFHGVNMTDAKDPSGTFLLVERWSRGNMQGCTSGDFSDGPGMSPIAPQYPIRPWTPPHNRKWSYLFVDGHAEQLEPEETIGKGTMEYPLGMWTKDPDD